MSKRRYVTVEAYMDVLGKWVPTLCQAVSPGIADGYLMREAENYPCRRLRVIDYHTHGVLKMQKANGEVTVNQSVGTMKGGER